MTLILNGTSNSATTPAVTSDDVDTGLYYPAANQVALATNGTLALIVDASQNVGIGTSNPNATLAVRSAVTGSSATARFRGTDTTARLTRIQLEDYTGTLSDGIIDFVVPTAGTASSSLLKIGVNSPMLTMNYNGAVALSGGVTNASGVGIVFPATQSASSDVNTLDDYEEGTWTPTLTFGGASVGLTYNTQVGTYRKVGSLVVAQFYISISNKGSSTGTVGLSGLPFTSTSVTNAYCAGAIWGATLASFSGSLISYIGPSSTGISIQQLTTAGANSSLTNSNIQTSTELMVTVSYQSA